MHNYYDLLNISPNANQSEIETVLDDQYTKWRALVTHHDSNIVAQSNQALCQLEEVRNTLLNPAKREVYNSLLSKQGNIGGLSDPDIMLAQNSISFGMAPPRPRSPGAGQVSQTEVERTDAWVCTNPSCRKANQIGTKFCVKCGKRIGFECPNCGDFVELSNKFCSSCGVDKVEHFKKVQVERIKNLQDQIRNIQQEIQEAEAEPGKYIKAHKYTFESIKVPNKLVNIGLTLYTFGSLLLIINMIRQFFSSVNFTLPIILCIIGYLLTIASKPKLNSDRVAFYVKDKLQPQLAQLRQTIGDIQHEAFGD